jgi:hypothetical protein
MLGLQEVGRVMGLLGELLGRGASILRMRFGRGGGSPLLLAEIGKAWG